MRPPGRAPANAVVLRAEGEARARGPVEPNEIAGLVGAAWGFAGERGEVIERGVELCGENTAVQQNGALGQGERVEVGVGRRGDGRKAAAPDVESVEKEQIVHPGSFPGEDGASKSGGENLAQIVRLDGLAGDDAVRVGGGDGERVGGVEGARADAVAEKAVVDGFAGLGDGVEAGGEVRLAGIVGGGGLAKRADCGLGEPGRRAGVAAARKARSGPGEELGGVGVAVGVGRGIAAGAGWDGEKGLGEVDAVTLRGGLGGGQAVQTGEAVFVFVGIEAGDEGQEFCRRGGLLFLGVQGWIAREAPRPAGAEPKPEERADCLVISGLPRGTPGGGKGTSTAPNGFTRLMRPGEGEEFARLAALPRSREPRPGQGERSRR